jgi:hypothetical protein
VFSGCVSHIFGKLLTRDSTLLQSEVCIINYGPPKCQESQFGNFTTPIKFKVNFFTLVSIKTILVLTSFWFFLVVLMVGFFIYWFVQFLATTFNSSLFFHKVHHEHIYRNFTIHTCKMLWIMVKFPYIHELHMDIKNISIQLTLLLPKAKKSNHEHLSWKIEVFHMVIMAM